ncbi:hypothetical protein GCM10020220_025790 [Nonomuraea rubra]
MFVRVSLYSVWAAPPGNAWCRLLRGAGWVKVTRGGGRWSADYARRQRGRHPGQVDDGVRLGRSTRADIALFPTCLAGR